MPNAMKRDKSDKEETATGLRPYLTPLMVVALSFGYAVGWGAFMMPGTSFLPGAGPLGTTIAVLLGTAAMLVFALNYHRMALRHNGPGGAFAYAQNSFGEDHGFLVGWFLFLAYISILWANATSVKLLVRFTMGDILQFGFHYNLAGFDIYLGEVLLSVAVILAVGLLCLCGRRLAAKLNTVLALVFAGGVVACFVGAAAKHGGGAAIGPAFASDGGAFSQIVCILAMMPWAFVGFEAISHSAAEFKFPVKRMFAIFAVALGVSALIYILLTILPTLALPEGYSNWEEYVRDLPNLGGIDAVPTFCAARRTFGTLGVALLGAAMVGGQITGIIGTYIALSRLMYAMAEDNILPKWFSELNRDAAPKNAILFIMGVSAVAPFFGRSVISWPVDVSSIGAAIAFGYTSAAAFKTFGVGGVGKVISGKVAGLIGLVMSIFFCLLLLIPNYVSGNALAAESYLLLAVWCILGFLYYKHVFLVDRNHSIGKSLVVWISLTIMIIFSSLMWVRQVTFDSVEEAIGALAEEAGVKERFEERMENLNGSMLGNSMCEMILLVVSLSIMVSLFSILRRREQQLAIEKSKAEDINKAKSYFFSTVSHDIRTPLNAIIGFSQMLKEGFKTEEERDQAVDSILVSGKTLLKLINDVLDLSKLEAGRMSIEPEPTKCQTLLTEIAESFRISAQKPHLEFRAKIGDMPILMLDPQRLRQIAFNLMGNAVKFTKSGFIEVRASFTHMPGFNHGTFCMQVEDSGCGISEEDLKRIATPYVQVGSKMARNGGTGLGLAISRQLATAMGGEMSLTSELGKGTTFTITIPGVEISHMPEDEKQDAVVPGPAQHAPESTNHGKNVANRLLLVDDQKINLMVLKAMLSKIGAFDLTLAQNGREALQILEDCADKPFDLVLTDMWMPEMDGEELVGIIRKHPRFSSLPVYVITADVETQKHYADLGFTGILLKPVTIERLTALLA